MDRNSRKILGGLSTAGLVLAGSLPLMAKHGQSYCAPSCDGPSKSAKAKKDKSAAKKDAGNSAKKAPPADKSKSAKSK